MFDYSKAFSRNIGWVTQQEQAQLRASRVAIAGMGGVGGAHLLTLTRLGVGKFHIADFDHFDLANFNRQAGASMASLDQPKVEVLAAMARDINPEVELQVFAGGVDRLNLPDFLRQVDLYVDGLDFFAFAARADTFAACASRYIPAITAAPLGIGAAALNFLPSSMRFEDYFLWEGQSDDEKALRFLIGLAPAGLHRSYLVDPAAVNLTEQRGPSSILGCQLCAAVAGAEALKILLGRGKVLAAPHGFQVDAYRNKMVHTWRPGGNKHPLQQLALQIARRQVAKMRSAP